MGNNETGRTYIRSTVLVELGFVGWSVVQSGRFFYIWAHVTYRQTSANMAQPHGSYCPWRAGSLGSRSGSPAISRASSPLFPRRGSIEMHRYSSPPCISQKYRPCCHFRGFQLPAPPVLGYPLRSWSAIASSANHEQHRVMPARAFSPPYTQPQN